MHWLIFFLTSTPLLILFIFLWIYLWAKNKHAYWRQRGIYSPRPIHWLYGHLFNCETGTSITQNFADICESSFNHKIPVVGLYIFHEPCLLLRDPLLIRRLILDEFLSVSNRRFCMRNQIDNDVNNNLYGLKSPWRTYLRTVFEISFSEDRLQALVIPLMLKDAEHLRCYLDKKVPSSEKVVLHVHGASRRFITDVMMSVVFGVGTNSFEEPDTEIYKHEFERDDNLFESAMLLVTAGLEASAMTITLTLFEMARNQKIQERVRQEIREKIGTEPITYELISRMSYLESVVSETLRMYPPVPFLKRVAQQNYKIPYSNIVIEKGTAVYVSLKNLHLNPLSFPYPRKYNPNRFSEQNDWRITEDTYLPFGEGPETCIGNRLARAQIKLGLIVVMMDYKISMSLNMRDRAKRTSANLNQDFLLTLEKSPVISD